MQFKQVSAALAVLAVALEIGAEVLHGVQGLADLVQRHVQITAMADESQPLGMRRGVHAVVVVAALCRWNQAFALVEAHRLHVASRLGRQLADLHADLPLA